METRLLSYTLHCGYPQHLETFIWVLFQCRCGITVSVLITVLTKETYLIGHPYVGFLLPTYLLGGYLFCVEWLIL